MGKDKITEEDTALFRDTVGEVKAVPADERIVPVKPKPSPRPRHPQHTAALPAAGYVQRDHATVVAPDDQLLFNRPGIQQRQQRRLKRGDIPAQARLDLHGQTIDQAGAALRDFLDAAVAAGLRCVSVVHGKGHGSESGRPVLKSQVNQWLRDTPDVLAFCSAQPRDGGAGAVYILLRRG